MFLASFPAGPLQANCYVVGQVGADCVVIDPGVDAVDLVADLVRRNNLHPTAVLCTHGHIDHVASAAPVSDHYQVPCYIHAADRHLLTDPWSGLTTHVANFVRRSFDRNLTEPRQVRCFNEGDVLELGDLTWTISHAPGHTPGSVLLHTPYADEEDVSGLLFSGDVLFAGSVGRSDLPDGDPRALVATLTTKVLTLADTVVVLPGHGPRTSVAHERATNPFFRARLMRTP